MARQRIGPKKVVRLRAKTGLPVLTALVRGGTDHRIDLCLEDGSIVELYPDGTMQKTQGIRWNVDEWRKEHKISP